MQPQRCYLRLHICVCLPLLLCLACHARATPPSAPPTAQDSSLYSPLTSPPEQCLIDIQRTLIATYAPYLSNFTGKIALVDVAIGTNLGDNVLWLGAKKLLQYFGKTPHILCAFSKLAIGDWEHCPTPAGLLSATEVGPLLVLWQPGGNWGELWSGVHKNRMRFIHELDELAKAQDRDVTVIQLPQSVFYYPHSQATKTDKQTIDNLQHIKFVMMTRSLGSHNIIQRELGTKGVANFESVCPDLAFMCGPQVSLEAPKVDILLLIRNDLESSLPNRGLEYINAFFSDPERSDITFKETDWNYAIQPWLDSHNSTRLPGGDMYGDLADVRMAAAISILGQGRVVVANRLHAVIVSNLLRKPHFWFEGRAAVGYGKVEQTRNYAYSVSEHCSEEVMQSYGSEASNEAEALMAALTKAVAYVRQTREAQSALH